PLRHLPRARPSGMGRSAPQPRVVADDGLVRRRVRGREAVAAGANESELTPRVRLRRGIDLRRLEPALAPHLLRRQPLRAAGLDTAVPTGRASPGTPGHSPLTRSGPPHQTVPDARAPCDELPAGMIASRSR